MCKRCYSPQFLISTSKQKAIVASFLIIFTVVSGTYLATGGLNLQSDDNDTGSNEPAITPTPNLINNTIPLSTPSPMNTNSTIPTPTPTLSAPNEENEEKIVRNTNTSEEKKALAIAEDNNATEALHIVPITDIGYSYPNFINSEVINYYHNKYENAKGITHCNYIATVHTWNQVHSIYEKNRSIIISNPNYSIQFPSKEGWGIQIHYAYLNNSRYEELNADKIDFSFSNCYVVEMKLEYSQYLGPTAGDNAEVYQIVILNEDFIPVLLCVQSQKAIS